MVGTNLVVDPHSFGNGLRHARIRISAKMAVPPARPRVLAAPFWHIRWAATGLDQRALNPILVRSFWHCAWTSCVAEVSARHKTLTRSWVSSSVKVSFLFARLVGLAMTTLSKHWLRRGPGFFASPICQHVPKWAHAAGKHHWQSSSKSMTPCKTQQLWLLQCCRWCMLTFPTYLPPNIYCDKLRVIRQRAHTVLCRNGNGNGRQSDWHGKVMATKQTESECILSWDHPPEPRVEGTPFPIPTGDQSFQIHRKDVPGLLARLSCYIPRKFKPILSP